MKPVVPSATRSDTHVPRWGPVPVSWLAVLLVALVSLWPAAVNGGPIWMSDTPSYMRAADSAYSKLFGLSTDWSGEYERLYHPPPSASSPTASPGAGAPQAESPVTLKGRSIFYGALLYATDLAGSLWLMLIIQALLAALSIVLTYSALCRARGSPDVPLLVPVGLGLAVATPLGFFVSYLMPDIFGGLALLAMANLLFLRSHLARGGRTFFVLLLAYALLSHNVNLTLATLLLIAAVGWRLVSRHGPSRTGLLQLAACVAIGFAGQLAFDLAVQRLTGAAPVRPPFVAMRLIADGPGLAYLKEHCDERPLLYCRIKHNAGAHSDTLLWSMDPARTLFRGLSPDQQRLAARQQTDFVLSVLRDRPVDTVVALTLDVAEQLLRFDMKGFRYSPEVKQRLAEVLPERLFRDVERSPAFQGTLPLRPTELLAALLTFGALLVVLGFLYRERGNGRTRDLRNACLFLLLAIGINAAICGALSGPKGRYQMRLIWVVPLLAAGILSSRATSLTGAPRAAQPLP